MASLSSYLPVDLLPEWWRALAADWAFSHESFTPSDDGWTLVLLAQNAASAPTIVLPSPDAEFSLSIGVLAALTVIRTWSDYRVRFNVATISVSLPALLKPARWDGQSLLPAGTGRASITVSLGSNLIEFNERRGIVFVDPSLAEITPTIDAAFFIGDTGIGIVIDDLAWTVGESGVEARVRMASLVFPAALGALPTIAITDAIINERGFSGTISGRWTLTFDRGVYSMNGQAVSLFGGFTGGLDSVDLTFVESRITGCTIAGELIVPYFDGGRDTAVRIAMAINDAGEISCEASAAAGSEIVLIKSELLRLKLRRLVISNAGLELSGALQPLVMAGQGMHWPELTVDDLRIGSDGKVSIGKAWMDLEELATLDLWGFKLELARLGIGTDETRSDGDRMWIDLSGSLQLMEQLPVGLGIEGFKISWPQVLPNVADPADFALALSKQVEVSFAGVELFYGVPGAVEFAGLIRFFKDAQVVGFAGDMQLRVPSAGFGAEAGLMIGFNQEEPPYPFLYLYFGVELPAGIPLAQSGLALKGAMGMFGINVVPDRTPEQNWYYDWYNRGPIVGAHPTNKWKPGRDALALGVGVTITTADGYVKGTRGLLVLSLPGPVLMIEGRALLLSGLTPGAEPPLRALAVFDGHAGTVQLNVEAEAELVEGVVSAYATAEAFFDFNDITRWHLYLGQDTPEDRRIRANILKIGDAFLFKADAYLMLDMAGEETLRSRMGIFVGFKPKIPDIGPASVTFEAALSGTGELSVQPEQFSGQIRLEGTVGLSLCGVGLQVGARSELATQGPVPFHVEAEVDISAEPPWPLDPIEASIHFEWSLPAPPQIDAPLRQVALGSRFSSQSSGMTPDGDVQAGSMLFASDPPQQRKPRAERSPVVAMDSYLVLDFTHEMNSAHFAVHPDGRTKIFDAGYFHFTPTLTGVRIFECRKNSDGTAPDESASQSPWQLIAQTGDSTRPLPGVWTAGSDPGSPAVPSARRLQLWSDNPLLQTQTAPNMAMSVLLGSTPSAEPLAARILDDYPSLMQPLPAAARRTCLTFDKWLGQARRAGERLKWRGVSLYGTRGNVRVQTTDHRCRSPKKQTCVSLMAAEDLQIDFPEPIAEVVVHWCQPVKLPAATEPAGRVSAHTTPITLDAHLARLSTDRESELVAQWQALQRAARAATSDTWLDVAQDARDLAAATADRLRHERNVDVAVTGTDCAWTIRAVDGTAFWSMSLTALEGLGIHKICWTTGADADRAARSREQAEANVTAVSGALEPTFRDDCFYRIEVLSEVARRLTLPEGLEFLRPIFTQLEAAVGGASPVRFAQTAFFQTVSPPADLRPYVSTVVPAPGPLLHFTADDVVVRFLRSTVAAMFGDTSPGRASLQVWARDSAGRSVRASSVTWSKAAHATLFDDERIWQEYRDQELNWPTRGPVADDVLTARFSGVTGLRPNTRYELLLVGNDTATITSLTPVLFHSRFTTSAFETFEKLAEPDADAQWPTLSFDGRLQLTTDFVEAQQNFAEASTAWHRADTDHRFGRLRDGRSGIEAARLALRAAKTALDDAFRATAAIISPARLAARPASRLGHVLLRSSERNGIVGAWITAPESLDLQSVTGLDEPVGHTTWRLQRNQANVPLHQVMGFFDSGSRHLILLKTAGTLLRGNYQVVLTHQRSSGRHEARIAFVVP